MPHSCLPDHPNQKEKIYPLYGLHLFCRHHSDMERKVFMRKQRILICDTDQAYARALSAYFISSGRNFEIASYSIPEKFAAERGAFDVSLLGKEFIQLMQERGIDASQFGRIFVLTGNVNESNGAYEVLYKFQQMKTFLNNVSQFPMRENLQNGMQTAAEWTGIYSPVRHELQLLFALAYCDQKRKTRPEEGLLFLDLEENSLMSELVGDAQSKNLTDYLYLLETNNVSTEELIGCFSVYHGFSYLPPVRFFQELVSVSEGRWKKFFASIAGLGFGQIVVLFDGSLRGMNGLMHYLKDLVLVGREGDFYRKYEKQIRYFLQEKEQPMMVRETVLPLSGANLIDGTYRFEQLLSGNLSKYAKRAMEAEPYGTAG